MKGGAQGLDSGPWGRCTLDLCLRNPPRRGPLMPQAPQVRMRS